MSYKLCSTCLKSISSLFFLLILQAPRAQDLSGLDQLIEQRKSLFDGQMAVMVWKDSLLYQKATGDFTIQTQEPVGCSSAWMTAALAMTFVDQGKISLDDPVSDYLPIFATYAKSYLTIRHCLANVTGLQGEKGGIEKFFQKTRFSMLEEQVNSFASGREILHNPGVSFSYNNIGTNIVGRVLEVVGKRSFDRLMQERIFRPLRMRKSRFSYETATDPFSGLITTPADFLNFQIMLLNKGSFMGKQVLTEDAVAEMQQIQTGEATIEFVPAATKDFAYGLGNWIDNSGGHTIYTSPGLSGGWPYIDTRKGYACIIFVPQKKKEDKNRDKRNNVYREIMDELDGLL